MALPLSRHRLLDFFCSLGRLTVEPSDAFRCVFQCGFAMVNACCSGKNRKQQCRIESHFGLPTIFEEAAQNVIAIHMFWIVHWHLSYFRHRWCRHLDRLGKYGHTRRRSIAKTWIPRGLFWMRSSDGHVLARAKRHGLCHRALLTINRH